jgi:hypothetical protein
MLVNKLFAGMIAITISVNWMVYVAVDDADTSIAKRYFGHHRGICNRYSLSVFRQG